MNRAEMIEDILDDERFASHPKFLDNMDDWTLKTLHGLVSEHEPPKQRYVYYAFRNGEACRTTIEDEIDNIMVFDMPYPDAFIMFDWKVKDITNCDDELESAVVDATQYGRKYE